MTIRTSFTPEEIAAYVEANKPDHPTAQGLAGFPPRYVELTMLLEQVEDAFAGRKTFERRIWDSMFGLLNLCPANQLDVASIWLPDIIRGVAGIDHALLKAIGGLGGPNAVAVLMIEMRRIECDMAEGLRTWHQAKLKSEWEERRQAAMQTLFEEDQDEIS